MTQEQLDQLTTLIEQHERVERLLAGRYIRCAREIEEAPYSVGVHRPMRWGMDSQEPFEHVYGVQLIDIDEQGVHLQDGQTTRALTWTWVNELDAVLEEVREQARPLGKQRLAEEAARQDEVEQQERAELARLYARAKEQGR